MISKRSSRSVADHSRVWFALIASTTLTVTINAQKVVMTPFEPAQHGFRFSNTFRNEAEFGPLKIVTKGRCGGMVYAALDYFLAHKRIPTIFRTPEVEHALAKYILNRQYTSMTDQGPLFAKKISDHLNIFVSKKDMFLSGIDYINGIRISIDKGIPIPVGLVDENLSASGNHQVLAIGYETAADSHKQKIFVYDPNVPGSIVTITPDPPRDRYIDSTGKIWRTLFNYSSYGQRSPWEPWTPNANSGFVAARNTLGYSVMWRGKGGGIGHTGLDQNKKWVKPFPIAPSNAARASSPVSVIVRENSTDQGFWIGPDGGVGTTFALLGKPYAQPFPIAPPNATRADSPLVSIYRGGQTDVYWIGPDGAIATTFSSDGIEWAKPFPISPPNAAGPGSQLAALARNSNLIEVFWTGPDGAIALGFSDRSQNNGKWSTPFPISPPRAARVGSPLAAVSKSEKDGQVFWIGPNGGIGSTNTTFGVNQDRWATPYPIGAAGVTRSDSSLVAISRIEGVLDIAYVNQQGGVDHLWHNGSMWQPVRQIVPPNSVKPGSPIALGSRLPYHMDLFFTNNSDGMSSCFWAGTVTAVPPFSGLFPLSGPGEVILR